MKTTSTTRFSEIAKLAGLIILAMGIGIPSTSEAQQECRGEQEWYQGACRHLDEITRMKEAARRKAEQLRRAKEKQRKEKEEKERRERERKQTKKELAEDRTACEAAREVLG